MRRTRIALLFTLTLLLAACTKPPLVEQESFVFGTLVQVKTWGLPDEEAHQAIGKVLREFDRLHKMLHAWQPSELTALNRAFTAGTTAHKVSPELAQLVSDAAAFAQRSDDLFNPALGKLIALWGFHNDEFKPALPPATQVDALIAARPRMSDINVAGDMVASRNPAVQVDLGGYAKGYALDRAAAILKQEGVHNALVNIGGNIIALGEAGNRPWKIGVQHPRRPAAIVVVELYHGEAIGTSGDYQRFFELDNQRYCHILDPRSGRPVQGVQSVTVIARATDQLARGGAAVGTLSDVASKPIFIAGVPGWQQAAQKMGVGLVMLIDAKGEAHLTQTFAKRSEFQQKGLVFHQP